MNLEYYIPRTRYTELQRFCGTYRTMEYDYRHLNCYSNAGLKQVETRKSFVDPTANRALIRASIKQKIDLIRNTAKAAAGPNAGYLMKNITEHTPYETLRYHEKMPLSKKEFTDIRCKFFWMLDKLYKIEYD